MLNGWRVFTDGVVVLDNTSLKGLDFCQHFFLFWFRQAITKKEAWYNIKYIVTFLFFMAGKTWPQTVQLTKAYNSYLKFKFKIYF